MFTFKDFMAIVESFLEDDEPDCEELQNDDMTEAFDSIWEGR